VTVVGWPVGGLISSTGGETPFLVSGTVHGRSVTVAVSAPDDVLGLIINWCAEDPRATGEWRLNSDYSEPVTTIARLRRGLVREVHRVAHLFRLLPGARQGFVLTAGCGETMPITDAEWLPIGAGMPCERCLSLAL
jgi:hypothetical protein